MGQDLIVQNRWRGRPRSWRAGNRGQQRISRCDRRLNSRGRGCPRSWWRLRWGRHLRSLRAGCLAHHTRLSPFVGVGAGLTSPVGIGKDGGHGGWLVLGVGGGVVDYQGTNNKKGDGKNLASGRG